MISMGEYLIHVLDQRVQLYQPAEGFRTSLDSVMLAAACPVRDGQSVLDLGCGVGSAGLCVMVRVTNISLSGADIQGDHIALAEKNAAANGVQARCRFLCADVRDLDLDAHDHVICNPPYLDSGAHTPSPRDAKALAMGHQDAELSLQDWVDCAFRHIKGRGSLTMIHEAGRVDEIILALGKRFGATEIIPLWPRAGVPAKRVIVRSWKHRKSPATIHPGLVLHETDSAYTPAAESVLRNARALFLL